MNERVCQAAASNVRFYRTLGGWLYDVLIHRVHVIELPSSQTSHLALITCLQANMIVELPAICRLAWSHVPFRKIKLVCRFCGRCAYVLCVFLLIHIRTAMPIITCFSVNVLLLS